MRLNLYFMSLVGAMSGTIAWSLGVWIPILIQTSKTNYWQAQTLESVLISLFISIFCLIYSEPIRDDFLDETLLNKCVRMLQKVLVGGTVGVLAGLLGVGIYFMIRQNVLHGHFEWYLPLLSWVLLGACIGGVLGLILHGFFVIRVVVCVIGGSLGSLLGAGVLLVWGETSALLAHLTHALGLTFIGMGITLGATAAINIVGRAKIKFEDSGIPEAKNKFGSRGMEWIVLPGETYFIGNLSNAREDARYRGTHQIDILDPGIKPYHVRIELIRGELQMKINERYVASKGRPLPPVVLKRGGNEKALLDEEWHRIVHRDQITVGATRFRIEFPRSGRQSVNAPMFASLAVIFGYLALPTLLFVLFSLLFVGIGPAGAQSSIPVDKPRFVEAEKVRLYEVTPHSERPAFQITTNILVGNQPLPIPYVASNEILRQLTVSCNSQPLQILHVRQNWRDKGTVQNATLKRTAILLVDVSGSMLERAQDGRIKFGAMQEACQQFVPNFVEGIDQVAVIPFGSVNVRQGVASAPFYTKKADLARAIETIPSPLTSANTGLFSAVYCALKRFQEVAERSRSTDDPIPQRLLVVMTDGINDVGHRGDDSGLLTDWRIVKRLADNLGVQIITVGFGDRTNIDENALRRLAWKSESNYIRAGNARELVQAFRTAHTLHLERLTITFLPTETQRVQLLKQRQFDLQWHPIRGETIAGSFIWTPAGVVGGSPFEGVLTDEERQTIPSDTSSEYVWLPTYLTILISLLIIYGLLWQKLRTQPHRHEVEVLRLRRRVESDFKAPPTM